MAQCNDTSLMLNAYHTLRIQNATAVKLPPWDGKSPTSFTKASPAPPTILCLARGRRYWARTCGLRQRRAGGACAACPCGCWGSFIDGVWLPTHCRAAGIFTFQLGPSCLSNGKHDSNVFALIDGFRFVCMHASSVTRLSSRLSSMQRGRGGLCAILGDGQTGW